MARHYTYSRGLLVHSTTLDVKEGFDSYYPSSLEERLNDFFYQAIFTVNSLVVREKSGKKDLKQTLLLRKQRVKSFTRFSGVSCQIQDDGKVIMYYQGKEYTPTR